MTSAPGPVISLATLTVSPMAADILGSPLIVIAFAVVTVVLAVTSSVVPASARRGRDHRTDRSPACLLRQLSTLHRYLSPPNRRCRDRRRRASRNRSPGR